MNEPSSTMTRTTWLLVIAAFASTVVVHGVVGFLLDTQREMPVEGWAPSLEPVFSIVALAALLAGILLFPRSLIRRETPVEIFVRRSLVSLAMIEAAAVVGLLRVILGRPVAGYLPFGAAALAVILFYILPRGIEYWRILERDARVRRGGV